MNGDAIEELTKFGASARACEQLRRLDITTISAMRPVVRDFQKLVGQWPQGHPAPRFDEYLACEHIGRNTGPQLLAAFLAAEVAGQQRALREGSPRYRRQMAETRRFTALRALQHEHPGL